MGLATKIASRQCCRSTPLMNASLRQFDADAWEGASLDGARITLSAAPEASTWAMMLIGFGGLGFAGYRASRMSGRRAAA
jgi:hypothetical protein